MTTAAVNGSAPATFPESPAHAAAAAGSTAERSVSELHPARPGQQPDTDTPSSNANDENQTVAGGLGAAQAPEDHTPPEAATRGPTGSAGGVPEATDAAAAAATAPAVPADTGAPGAGGGGGGGGGGNGGGGGRGGGSEREGSGDVAGTKPQPEGPNLGTAARESGDRGRSEEGAGSPRPNDHAPGQISNEVAETAKMETSEPPPAKSSRIGPQASRPTRKGRWALKNQIKCGFCGGKLCLRCSEQCALRCKGAAVTGLHSHWITDSIMAMQRPSSRLMKVYDIVGQFKRKGVTAIFNLTEPGEHPHCGDGLEKTSGFPYLPETFMREGISVYNFAWEDMTTPSMPRLTDIVRVAVSCLRRGGKIAVHCHAGYGRTGLVIASILVMMKNLPARKAVALVREKRPTSVQTNAQVAIVAEFANFVRGVRVVYHFTDHARVTLGQHLAQQAFLLHGQESVHLRWLPKPVALATRMLVALAREKPWAVVLALAGVEGGSIDRANISRTDRVLPWGMAEEQHLKAMEYSSNANDWDEWEFLAGQCDARPATVDPRIPAQLMYDWLAQLAVPAIVVTELRRVLPLSAMSSTSSDDEQEATLRTSTCFEVGPEGLFHRFNLLPVGQVRLVQCLIDCLRSIREALATAGIPEGNEFQKGCLRVAIALVKLDMVHEGLLVGRNIATDALQAIAAPSTPLSARSLHSQHSPEASPRLGRSSSLAEDLGFCSRVVDVLLKSWRAPLRCRPYSKLEALNNQPEIHGGNEDYWNQKRRSVVPPKDFVHAGAAKDIEAQGPECASMSQHTFGYTVSLRTVHSIDTFSSWGTKDDADIVKVPTDGVSYPATKASSSRRRSMSSGNVKQTLENLAPFDEIRPLETIHDGTGA